MRSNENSEKTESKMKNLMIVVTPILTVIAIFFTFSTYYIDVLKEPQLNLKSSLKKEGSLGDSLWIVKITVEVQNKSKTTINIAGLIGQLLGKEMRPLNSNDTMFSDRIKRDTIGSSYLGYYIETDRNVKSDARDYQTFYSITADRNIIQPEEIFYYERITFVPVNYRVASFELQAIFNGKNIKNPFRVLKEVFSKSEIERTESKFTIEPTGSVEFNLENNIVDGDTLSIDNKDILLKHGYYTTTSKTELWLGDSVK